MRNDEDKLFGEIFATKKAISEREEGVTVVINLNKIKCYFHPNEGESSGMIITD